MKCINIFIQTRHIRFTVHSEAKTNPNLPLSYQRQDIIEPSNLDDMSHFTYEPFDMAMILAGNVRHDLSTACSGALSISRHSKIVGKLFQ